MEASGEDVYKRQPQEYTGELYAGRIENGSVVYNGLAGIRNAAIPFKYNTCDKMELAYSKYTVSAVSYTHLIL